MSLHSPPPGAWLPDLASELDRTLVGLTIEGVVSGTVWMSLRIGGRFLWILSSAGLRLAWLDEHPTPRAWLDLLERHRKSPFAAHLRERTVAGVHLLVTENEVADGFALRLDHDRGPWLAARFWPRPGAIWLTSERGEEIARAGRMDGAPLEMLSPGTPAFAAIAAKAAGLAAASPDDAVPARAHAAAARETLAALVVETARRRLRHELSAALKKQRRLTAVLQREAEAAQADLGLRVRADTLAAHLHQIRPGQSEAELTGFDGETVRIELDPALTPAANLDRLYRRAAKAERKVAAVEARREANATRSPNLARAVAELEQVTSLDAVLELARSQSIDLVREAGPARGRSVPRGRLPYWRFRLASGFEIRVGRSAKDNDALTQRHSTGRDRWFHASGVEGSHVILRTAGREVPARALEDAARLAAQYSRAKHSETVPVLVTERRHVRKPRGAAPGAVIADRARTLFVSPGVPEGCIRIQDEEPQER